MRNYTMLVGGLSASFLTASLFAAAEPAPEAAKEVESSMRKLNDAFRTRDADAIRQLMSKDHVTILSDGRRFTGFERLPALGGLAITEHRIGDVKVAMPAQDLAVVTYEVRLKGSRDGKELPPKIMVSSVWTRQDGKWLEVLYQQTAVENR